MMETKSVMLQTLCVPCACRCEAHHLPKTHDAVPGHHHPDLLRTDVGTRVLEPRHGRHAGGHVGHGLKGGALGVVDHGLHALGAADVANLVGVHEDAGGPVGHHRTGVFAHADHGGFHMDMGVHEARRDVLAGSVDDLGVLADAMGGVAHEGDPALGDGYVDPFLGFTVQAVQPVDMFPRCGHVETVVLMTRTEREQS